MSNIEQNSALLSAIRMRMKQHSKGINGLRNDPQELASMKDDISSMRLEIHNLERRLAAIEQRKGTVAVLDLTEPRRNKGPSPSA